MYKIIIYLLLVMDKIINRFEISLYFEIFIYLSAKQFWGVKPLSVTAAKLNFMT